jgi:hypothetical protein
VVFTDNNPEDAQRMVYELISFAWTARREFMFEIEPLEKSVARAKEMGDPSKGPIMLLDHYDNCASGEPIEYLVAHRESGMGLIVTGQHCPGNSGSWLIGVANWDPDFCDTSFPRWPMRIEAQDYRNGFQPSLFIEAPEGVTVTCLTRANV